MKKYTTYLNNKGQITIPSKMRTELGISQGSKVEFMISSKHLVVIPINKSVGYLKGVLDKPSVSLSIEEMNEVIRSR